MLTLRDEIRALATSLRQFERLDRDAADPHYTRTADAWAMCAHWLEGSLRRTADETQEERYEFCPNIPAAH